MAIVYVYVPEYADTGWFDNDGYTKPSWFNRDLTDDAPITLNILEPVFFDDPDLILLLQGDGSGTPNGTPIPNRGVPGGLIFLDAGITVELTAAFFDDPDTFFVPIAIRALKQSDQMLKNEVRRIR